MRLVLARHGQTTSNVDGTIDTLLPGPGLTDLGRAQAAALGAVLAGGADGPVVGVYCSPARRARETAAFVGAALGLSVHDADGTYEVQAGPLMEGRNDAATVEAFREVFVRWRSGDLDARFAGGGESGTEVTARLRAAVEGIRARHPGDGTAVLVTHGAALRFVAEVLTGHGPPGEEDRIDNCGRVVLRTSGASAWSLAAWLGDAPGGAPSARDATTG